MQNCGSPSGGLLFVAGEKGVLLATKRHPSEITFHYLTGQAKKMGEKWPKKWFLKQNIVARRIETCRMQKIISKKTFWLSNNQNIVKVTKRPK